MEIIEHKLIASIYDAALEPDRWWSVLREIREIIDADLCALIFHDALNRTRNAVYAAGECEKSCAHFLSEFIDVEIRGARTFFQKIDDGHFLSSSKMLDLKGKPYEAYIGEAAEFHVDAEISMRAGGRLMQNEFFTSILGAHRRPTRPELSSSAMQLLDTLAPHFVRAVRIHNQLSAARNQNERLMDALRRINTGVLLLDSEMRVIFSNQEAARVLEHHPALQIGRFGCLYSPLLDQQRSLQQLLRRMLENGKDDVTATSLALRHERRVQPLKLTVLPLLASGLGPTFANEGIALAVFVADPDRPRIIPSDYLKQTYGLTAAECAIAQGLLNGGSIAGIAEQRGTTENTARWQTKCLLQKTFTSTQAELVRLLAALSADYSPPID